MCIVIMDGFDSQYRLTNYSSTQKMMLCSQNLGKLSQINKDSPCICDMIRPSLIHMLQA
jgi:hypothetical protein